MCVNLLAWELVFCQTIELWALKKRRGRDGWKGKGREGREGKFRSFSNSIRHSGTLKYISVSKNQPNQEDQQVKKNQCFFPTENLLKVNFYLFFPTCIKCVNYFWKMDLRWRFSVNKKKATCQFQVALKIPHNKVKKFTAHLFLHFWRYFIFPIWLPCLRCHKFFSNSVFPPTSSRISKISKSNGGCGQGQVQPYRFRLGSLSRYFRWNILTLTPVFWEY